MLDPSDIFRRIRDACKYRVLCRDMNTGKFYRRCDQEDMRKPGSGGVDCDEDSCPYMRGIANDERNPDE